MSWRIFPTPGFLEQPHASAGRVPTTEAYRYYVEQISGNARLAPQEEAMISDSLAGITDVQEFMERTSHVLSLISRNVGVTVATSGPKNALEHVYFSRLGDQKVLAVRGDALWPGARSRAAHGSAAVRSRPGRALHQREFSRLDHGVHARRTRSPHRERAQRVRPADEFD